MAEKIIAYFAKRHLLTNLIFIAVFVGGAFAWQQTSKEEMPPITFDTVRISVRYPGAPSQDVEYFVTKPIEEEVRSIDGVHRVLSNSSVGSANINVELEQDIPNVEEVITELRNAVLDVDLPDEVLDDPNVRVFKTTKKAILDIALYHKTAPILDADTRRQLQQYAFALENQLLNIPEVNSVTKSGYLQEEIKIKVYPEKLKRYDIPFNTVMKEIKDNHVRQPAGSIEAKKEPKVTLLSELDTEEKLYDLIIQGGFEGQVIRLGEVAEIEQAYEKNETVHKVNGHEAVMFNVVKSSSYGILEAMDATLRVVENFKKNNLGGVPVEVILLDDESIDVRNRLQIIAFNGTIGFFLILATLFVFLNKRSGFWVAMGIPFTFCFTMIAASFLGYTINGTTLAAVIIVMGIVVDDAIVVAENITRLFHKGMDHKEAVVKGASYVLLPIIASIVTTCVAFVPLFFFQGRHGRFIEFIPPVIFLMLGASLLESVFILPGHMNLHIPFLDRFKNKEQKKTDSNGHAHWFDKVEDRYGRFLEKALPRKNQVFLGFVLLLVLSVVLFNVRMKFVMFPNEETRDIVLTGKASEGMSRYETARMVRAIEDIFIPYIGKEVVGFRTTVAQSRRGSAVEENNFRMIIEIVPKEKRKKSADQLVKEFDGKIKKLEGFQKLVFAKSRWGSDTGSPIELVIQQNDDDKRHAIAQQLAEKMKQDKALKNVETDEGQRVDEYRVSINREMVKRLSIAPVDVASTFRAALEGTVLYEFSNGEEDINVRFTVVDEAKDDIEKILDLPVENKNDYLVPLRNVVEFERVVSQNAIARQDLKRTTIIDADINKKGRKTPLEIASYYEENVFPQVLLQYPTTTLSFAGEIKDTRESKADFQNAVILAVLLIFIVLAVLFNSLTKPLIIMLAIPFGLVGIIIAFALHGKVLFGFYAAVGALGLAGVVINDAIIMLVKMDKEYNSESPPDQSARQIAQIAQTRLRAVLLTTLTTVAGVLPTAYGFAGYDATLSEMMLALTWGMIFGTAITLLLIPCLYSLTKDFQYRFKKVIVL